MREGAGMANSAIPTIDPRVKHVGVSKLRELNATKLAEQTDETLVIQDNDKPLAVLLSYEQFLIMQEQLASVMNTLELVSDDLERKGLLAGIADLRAGRLHSMEDIEAELERK
jgi:PHD/YefM family antitoxin component YafN of YafNO toxin-antitoxin module